MLHLYRFFLLVGLLSLSSAQVTVWTGATSTDWSEPTNWSTGTVPTITNDVFISGPLAGNKPIVDTTNAICQSLNIAGDTLQIAIGKQLDVVQNLNFNAASDILLNPNSRLKVQGNIDNTTGGGNLTSLPGSRVILYGVTNTEIIGQITFYDITINKDASAIVDNAPLCAFGVPSQVIVDNNLTIDKGVFRLCDTDGVQDEANGDLIVKGNIVINNSGGLDVTGREDRDQGCTGNYNSENLVVTLGGNLSDNSSPYNPNFDRGFFIGDLTINAADFRGQRALLVFNGARDQTVLGQYTLTDQGNVPNQGAGIWVPRILVNKPDATKRVAMLTNMRIYGDSEVRSGILLLNGKRLLYGEYRDETLDITNSGVLYANDGSELRMLSDNANGSVLRVYAGGYLKMIGSAQDRITVTRDAGSAGKYYRTGVYSGGQVACRYVDFNFQGRSNSGFNTLLGDACSCTDPTDECYNSQGGMKVFAGAILDPEGLGANFSDCAFSAGGNAYTGLLLNVAGSHTLTNLVFNGSNQDATIPHIFGNPPNGTCDDFVSPTDQCLCRGGSVTPTNIISNNPATIITVLNSSGMIGGEIIGEYFDAGTQDYTRSFLDPDYSGDPDNQVWEYHDEGGTPYVDDNIVWTGKNIAVWIGRSNSSNNWSDIDNWSTKEMAGSPVPGVDDPDFTVVIPRGAARNVVVDVDVQIGGSVYVNMPIWTIQAKYLDNSLGIYPASTAYAQTTNNRSVTVNVGQTWDMDLDLFNYSNGTITMTGVSFMNIGGNYFNHFGGATFNDGNSVVTMDGLSVQQVRTGNDPFFDYVVNKPSSTVYIQRNNITVDNDYTHESGTLELFTGMQMNVNGDFTMNSGRQVWNFSPLFFAGDFIINDGELMPQGSGVEFDADGAVTRTIKTNNQPFNYLEFGGPNTGTVYDLQDNLTILSSHKGKTELNPISDTYNQSYIKAGKTLNLNGNQMRVKHFLIDGTLNINAGTGLRGGELLIQGDDDPNTTGTGSYTYPSAGVLKDNAVYVSAAGALNVIGTSTKTSKISRDGISGRYELTIDGEFSAENALFDLMDANGINAVNGTIITPPSGNSSFSFCTFTNGASGGILLQLPKKWPNERTILNASFPTNAGGGAVNVYRTTAGGGPSNDITFSLPSGIFAGEPFDDDDCEPCTDTWIDWDLSNIFRWDGSAGDNNWHTAANWCPNAVPGPTDDVILDHTDCSPAAIIDIDVFAAPVSIRDLVIDPDGGNAIRVHVTNNFEVNGQFTNKADGVFDIDDANSDIIFHKSFSNEGIFENGGGRIDFDGSGISVINNASYQDYPFYNMRVLNGIYELNSWITVENDILIQSTGILDASNDNFKIELGGNWTNTNGDFEPRFGTVAFVDFDAHTELIGTRADASSMKNYAAVSNDQIMRYTYTGTLADSIANPDSVSESFFNLLVDKHLSPSTFQVSLRGKAKVDGVLDLRSRNLNTLCSSCPSPGITVQDYENVAILGLFGSWTNASDVSFVNGPLARTYISNVPFNYDFPIGKFTEYVKQMELEISLATNGPEKALFAVEQFNEPIDTLNRPVPAPCVLPSPGLQQVLLNRYWNVAQMNPAIWGGPVLSSGNVKLVWDGNDGITPTFENIRAVKDVGPDLRGLSPKTNAEMDQFATNCAPVSAQINGNELGGEIITLTGFGTLGDGDFGIVYFDQVLPIDNIDFYAKYSEPGAKLNWNTENEVNNKGFWVTRAEGAPVNFKQISHYQLNSQLLGKGTFEGVSNYQLFDQDRLLPGQTYHYRLYSQDFDGSVHLNGERKIVVPLADYLGNAYPNPFNDYMTVPFAISEDGPVTMELITLQGRKIQSLLSNQQMEKGAHTLRIDTPDLSAGVYILKMTTPNDVKTMRVVKQD